MERIKEFWRRHKKKVVIGGLIVGGGLLLIFAGKDKKTPKMACGSATQDVELYAKMLEPPTVTVGSHTAEIITDGEDYAYLWFDKMEINELGTLGEQLAEKFNLGENPDYAQIGINVRGINKK